jgi:hypothetical protein
MRRQLLFAVGILLGAAAVVFLGSAAYATAFRDHLDTCASVGGDAAYYACVEANRDKNPVQLHIEHWIVGGSLAAASAMVLLAPRLRRTKRTLAGAA